MMLRPGKLSLLGCSVNWEKAGAKVLFDGGWET